MHFFMQVLIKFLFVNLENSDIHGTMSWMKLNKHITFYIVCISQKDYLNR